MEDLSEFLRETDCIDFSNPLIVQKADELKAASSDEVDYIERAYRFATENDTALILQENPRNILRPVVLCFRDNSIMNLADTYMYGDIEVKGIMKTLDNRYIMDKETVDYHSSDPDDEV